MEEKNEENKKSGTAAWTMSGPRRFLYKYMEKFSLKNQIM